MTPALLSLEWISKGKIIEKYTQILLKDAAGHVKMTENVHHGQESEEMGDVFSRVEYHRDWEIEELMVVLHSKDFIIPCQQSCKQGG